MISNWTRPICWLSDTRTFDLKVKKKYIELEKNNRMIKRLNIKRMNFQGMKWRKTFEEFIFISIVSFFSVYSSDFFILSVKIHHLSIKSITPGLLTNLSLWKALNWQSLWNFGKVLVWSLQSSWHATKHDHFTII